MKIFGHGLREHMQLLAPLFALIAAVWALRLVAGAAGVPPGLVRVISVTVASAVAVVLAAVLIHVRQFGSYPSVVMAVFLLVLWEQILIVCAIAFAILTRTQNIFLAPEFSSPRFTARQHMIGHLTFALGFDTLIGTVMGCFLFWMVRRLVPLVPGRGVQ